MKIVYKKLNEIIPYAKNSKKHPEKQVKQIADSIKAFGFRQPLVIDKENNLMVGHGRLLGAKLLKFTEVPCLIADDLSPEQIKAYRLADNKLNESEWDMDFVLPELKELSIDLQQLTGFDLDLLIEPDEKDDVVPENVPAIAKLGDIYQLGRHRVMCGDSTKKEDVEKLLLGKEPYLMITDPPYGVDYDPNWRNNVERSNGKMIGGRAIGQVKNDDNADWSMAWQLSPSRVAYVYHAGKYSGIVQASLEICEFEIRSQIIWVKSNFAISRGDYHWKHEPCWYAVKRGNKGNWAGDRTQTTVWEINKPSKSETGHSTQKPVECMLRPILNHDGDVYDPFLGSGSTLIAAEKTNRICYGMEIDPHYVDVILKRWEDYTGNKAIKL